MAEKEPVILEITNCPVCGHPMELHNIIETELELEDGKIIKGYDIMCEVDDCEQTSGKVGICFQSAHAELLSDESEED